MPNSTAIFKKQVIAWINNNFPKDAKILDVGAGSGHWRKFLYNYPDMHAIEIFAPYVEKFHLEDSYVTCTTGNVIEQPAEFFLGYDLIIMGDVVEHMSQEDALSVIDKIEETTTVIIGVPWGPQDMSNGNIYEIHIQDKLTNKGFLENYPTFDLFCLHDNYAIYIDKPSLDPREVIYTYQLPPWDLEEAQAMYPDREFVPIDDEPNKGYVDYSLFPF